MAPSVWNSLSQQIVSSHSISLQQYADHTQLFLALSRDTGTTAIVKLEHSMPGFVTTGRP